jgi:hypothetical protein
MQGRQALDAHGSTLTLAALALAAGMLHGATGDSLMAGESDGRLHLAATRAATGPALDAAREAPSVEEAVSSARITVAEVVLVPHEDDEPVIVHAADQGPIVLDLFDLEAGVEAAILVAAVPDGDYDRLELEVKNARVTLSRGFAFRDGSAMQDLKVPDDRIRIQDAPETLELVIAFDPAANFRILGDPEAPDAVAGVLFKPTLKEIRRAVHGEDL